MFRQGECLRETQAVSFHEHDAAPGTQGAHHDRNTHRHHVRHRHHDRSGHCGYRRAWRHGLVAGALASLATFAIAAIAAIADAAGVAFVDKNDEAIPLAGFPEFTMLFTLIGIAIAARMAREPSTHSPRSCAPPSPSLHCRSSPTS